MSVTLQPLAAADRAPRTCAAVPAVANRRWATAGVLMASDAAALAAGLGLGLGTRLLMERSLDVEPFLRLWPVLVLFIFAFAKIGLYPGELLGPVEELRRTSLATSIGYLALGAFTFLIQGGIEYSRAVSLLAWGYSLALIPLGRAFARRLFDHRPWWGSTALVLGAGETGRSVVRTLLRHPGLGLRPVAVLDDDPAKWGDLLGVPILGPTERAPTLAAAGVRYAILAMPRAPRERVLDLLEHHLTSFPNVLVVPELRGFARLWVSARDLGGLSALELRHHLLDPGVAAVKRAVDVVLASVAAALFLPLGLLIALAIKLESRGPVFFVQERLAKDKRRIRVFKFRSMYEDAEDRLLELLKDDPTFAEEYARFHKLERDPRVTWAGWFLRKYSLDEMPQLLNVLRGDMSLVGPRPYMPSEIPAMNGADRVILRIRQGVTGLWQVTGRNEVTFQDRLDMDVYYVRNWSFWLDIYLLARTAGVVLLGRGAR